MHRFPFKWGYHGFFLPLSFSSTDKKQKRSRTDYCSKCYMSTLHTGWTRVLLPDSSCVEWVRRLLYSSVLHATVRLQQITAVKLCGAVCWCRRKKKKRRMPKHSNAKCVATIYLFIFLKPGTGLLGKRKRREGNILHKWWLIAEAFFFAHAPQINVSPVYTAHSTLSNRTVRDICHVTGWRRRLLHPSRPIGEGRNKVPQEAPGIGVTPAAPREASDFFFFPGEQSEQLGGVSLQLISTIHPFFYPAAFRRRDKQHRPKIVSPHLGCEMLL